MEETTKKKEMGTFMYVLIGLLIIFVITSGVLGLKVLKGNKGGSITGAVVGVSDVIPKGVPKIYGKELGVSFDDITPANPGKADVTITKLGKLDNEIKLEGEMLNRYIKIAGQISCEYCCGAKSIIFTSDAGKYKAGDAACGCAHSYAMRGLGKYLVKNTDMSDDEVLEELGKWKTLFFPDIMTQKAGVLKQKGIEFNYINLASNKYRGIEKGATGGSMVGGC